MVRTDGIESGIGTMSITVSSGSNADSGLIVESSDLAVISPTQVSLAETSGSVVLAGQPTLPVPISESSECLTIFHCIKTY